MARVRKPVAPPPPPSLVAGESDLDLTEAIHARISPAAKAMLRKRAREASLLPATWVRREIYRALGLLKD